MGDSIWTPPGLSKDEAAAFLVARQGIPEHARPEIVRWLIRDRYDHQAADLSEYLKFQTALRRPLGLSAARITTVGSLRNWVAELDEYTLTALIDYRLSNCLPRPSFDPRPRNAVAAIKEILKAASSSWTVGDRNGRWGLLEALPEAVIDAAQAIVSQAGKAGEPLNSAWGTPSVPTSVPAMPISMPYERRSLFMSVDFTKGPGRHAGQGHQCSREQATGLGLRFIG